MHSARYRVRECGGKQKTPAALGDRAPESNESSFRSVADVDGAEGDAVRGEHPAGHVAAVISAVADANAEAMAPVVVMMRMEGRPDEPTRRSGGGSQRHGAEGGGGSDTENSL